MGPQPSYLKTVLPARIMLSGRGEYSATLTPHSKPSQAHGTPQSKQTPSPPHPLRQINDFEDWLQRYSVLTMGLGGGGGSAPAAWQSTQRKA